MFKAWPKIPRYENDTVVITEKIDGTNACVIIADTNLDIPYIYSKDGIGVYAQSRTKLIYPGKDTDNYGFAAWVEYHAEELLGLGEGYHYGEWWGQGIQRKYDKTDKIFSLFNSGRWAYDKEHVPLCCSVVPILYQGKLTDGEIEHQIQQMKTYGSVASEGYMSPEGLVIYYTQSKMYQKVIINK